MSRSGLLPRALEVDAADIAVAGRNIVGIVHNRPDGLRHHIAEDTVVAAAHSTAARILGVAAGVAMVVLAALAVPAAPAVLVAAGPVGSVGLSAADGIGPWMGLCECLLGYPCK